MKFYSVFLENSEMKMLAKTMETDQKSKTYPVGIILKKEGMFMDVDPGEDDSTPIADVMAFSEGEEFWRVTLSQRMLEYWSENDAVFKTHTQKILLRKIFSEIFPWKQ